MSNNIDLIGREVYQIGNITIKIPKVEMIRGADAKKEKAFWQEITLFTKTPQDMISELDSSGIDFEDITDYKLFLMLYSVMRLDEEAEDLLFEGIDFFDLILDNDFRLTDNDGNVVIDETVYAELSEVICAMVVHEKTKPIVFGNAYAKKERIKADYRKKEKAKKEANTASNALGGIILRLVCNNNFPYNFKTVNDITIYELLHSLKQIDKDISVTELLQSGFAGNDLSNVPAEKLSRYTM